MALFETLAEVRGRMYMCDEMALSTAVLEIDDGTDITELNRNQLLQLLEKKITSWEADEDNGLTKLLTLNDTFIKIAPPTVPAETPKDVSSEEVTDTETVKNEKVPLSLWKRDFKISGQIGDPTSATCVGFISLSRHIESGLKKGYSKGEVIDGVIKSIQPGLKLRSYLEGRPEMELTTLYGILRAHYKEKRATELYQELSSLVQGTSEDTHDFLIRALDLKQRVIFASKVNTKDVKYEEKMVKDVFCRAVYTGFRDETIRNEMKQYLECGVEIKDEELLQELSSILLKESERQHKFGKKKDTSKIKVSQVDMAKQIDNAKEKQKEGVLMGEVKLLRAEIAALKEQVFENSKNVQGRHTPFWYWVRGPWNWEN